MDPAPNGTTPLGEPLSLASASHRARDPHMWHQHYWLNLSVIATKCGEHPTLTAIRIEMEQAKLERPEPCAQLRSAQRQFQTANRPRYWRHWTQRTLDDEEARKYVADLERMLVDKERKMKDYLRGVEVEMRESERMDVSEYYDVFPLARQLLEVEIARDAGQPSGGRNDDDVEMEDV